MWLDPGLTTGVASWHETTATFWAGQLDEEHLVEGLERLCEKNAGRTIWLGYEKYIVTSGGPRTGTPRHSLGAIGKVEAMAMGGAFNLLKSQPSASRLLANAVQLRRIGWYRTGQRHANDASQHLLAHLIRQRPMSPYVRHKLFQGYEQSVTIGP